jgi:hypothetical protein
LHRSPLLLGWDLRVHVCCQTQRCKQDQRRGEDTWGSGKSIHSLIPWLLCFMVREGRSSAHFFIGNSMPALEGSCRRRAPTLHDELLQTCSNCNNTSCPSG